jgi:DNA-binding CsgD family transcriptional regulator
MATEPRDEPAQTPSWNPQMMPPPPGARGDGASIDIAALLALAESLAGQMHGIADRLCEKVTAITDGRACLQICPAQHVHRASTRLPEGARLVPVEFNGWVYGAVIVRPDPADTAMPGLPEPQAHELASACGAILHLLELAALVQVLSQHLPADLPEHLTPRQQEILDLILQGLSDEEIVEALRIAPETLKKHRHQIYARLGVHRSHDVLLAAYQAHLGSYLTVSHSATGQPPSATRRLH